MNKQFFLKIVLIALMVSIVPIGGLIIKNSKIQAKAPTPVTLFYSSFEGTNPWNNWSIHSSNWESTGPKNDAPCDDKKAEVKLKGDGNSEILQSISISTLGYSNIILTYKYKIEKDLEPGDGVTVAWSTDNSIWHTLATYTGVKNNNWQEANFGPIIEAENQGTLYLKFTASFTKQSGGDDDAFWLDCVELEGTPIPVCTDADQDTYSVEGGLCGPVDCDDSNSGVHPGATELCNEIDDDCDGQVDEGVTTTYYQDSDGDDYGNPTLTTQACSAPQGYVTDNTDCNDSNSSVHSGATEICDNDLDDDCDGYTDTNDTDCYACTPDTTRSCTTDQSGICSAGTQICSSKGIWGICEPNNTPTTEICDNQLDDDCDGYVDNLDTDCQGSITGHKYNDLNKDGVNEEGELGLGGWTICIDGNKDGDCNDEEDSPTTTTSSDEENLGLYGFSSMPVGTYQVCEIMKEGWTSKNNLCQTVEVTTGQAATADFFNYEIPAQTQKYTCNTSTWTCVAGETGDYDTEAACLSACKAPTGGGGGAGGGGGVYPPPQILVPQVLGAATEATEEGQGTETTISCGPYLLKFIKWGINNDPEEVKKLQAFLNEYLNLDLPLSGIYDQATYEAVKQFQLLLKDEVLTPWVNIGCLPSNTTPTGYVYLTTTRAINNIVCPELHLPMPNLSSIQCVGGNIIGLGESGTVLGESTTTPETEITAPTTTEETEPTGTEATEAVEETTTSEEAVSGGSQAWVWVLVGIIVIGGALYLIFFKKKK